MVVVKRAFKWLLEVATSDALGRLIVFLIALAAASNAASGDATKVSWSVAGSFAGILIVSTIKQRWEYRNEHYKIIRRTHKMVLSDGGRHVDFSVELTIRSTQKGLRSCAVRSSWSGETLLTTPNVFSKIGRGFTIRVDSDPEAASPNFTFDFERPLKRLHKKTVGISFSLSEPNRSYKPFIGIDPSAWAWSSFSKMTMELVWNTAGILDIDSIYAAAFRSGWDLHRQVNSAMNEWKGSVLKTPKQGMGRVWTIGPVRSDRYYALIFDLVKPN